VVAVSDFPPTDEHKEVHIILQKRLETYSADLKELIDGDFKSFMKLLNDKGVGAILSD
jgi:hypothetical protein